VNFTNSALLPVLVMLA